MVYGIPGQRQLGIKTIILDLNGTLSVAGTVPEGVKKRLDQLKSKGFKVLFFTGNTRNDADALATDLGIELSSTPKPRPYQLRYVRQLASRLREQTAWGLGSSVTHVASFHCKS